MAIALKKQLDLPATTNSLLPLRGFLERCLDEAEITGEPRRMVQVGVDGALAQFLANGDGRRRGNLSLIFDVNDTRLRIVLNDESDGAELEARQSGTLMTEALRSRGEAGMSVLRRVMDEVRYHYTRGFENKLELVKFL